jgi:glucose/arabinose dehydrogenase
MRQAAVLAVVAVAAVLISCQSAPEVAPPSRALTEELSATPPPPQEKSEPAEPPAPPVELKRSDKLEAERPRPKQPRFDGRRRVTAADIELPPGYAIAAVARGLTFPTGIAFDDLARPHVVEAGYGPVDVWTEPRLLRIEPNAKTVVAQGQRNGPWNGVIYGDGKFYVVEGGLLKGGRLLQIGRDGKIKFVVNGLPTRGDHPATGPAMGPDGAVYFGVGTVTNAGVVGPDNFLAGWLPRFPTIADVPCRDVALRGQTFTSPDVLGDGESEVRTGAFRPFGQAAYPGEVAGAREPCNGSIMRLTPDGTVELIASGLRNPFGLAFSPDGKLFVTNQGYDPRGSRPTTAAGDHLWQVRGGAWYGWPDLGAQGEPAGEPVLAHHPGAVPAPAAFFGVQASPGGFDFSTSDYFGHVGEAFVALAGDRVLAANGKRPRQPTGFKIVRVDVNTGRVEDFAANRARGPASQAGSGGFERPIAVRFAPHGQALYVVDYGVMLLDENGAYAQRGTGVLWRITRTTPPPQK